MNIIYKLVDSYNKANICTEILYNNSKPYFLLQDVFDFFQLHDFKKSDCENIKFISNAEIMIDNKQYSTSSNLVIYVFSQDSKVKEMIYELFQKCGNKLTQVPHIVSDTNITDYVTINQPLEDKEVKITPEIISESNKTTIELFKNKNLKTLIKIFYEDPNVFKTFSSYITSGNMVENPFSEAPEEDYTYQYEYILSLEIPVNHSDIKNALKKFNGHINLTLRYLLTFDSINN
jgi:hypothetical protein